MIYPENRFKFSARKKKISSGFLKLLIIIAVAGLISVTLYIIIKGQIFGIPLKRTNETRQIVDLWRNQKYEEVLKQAEVLLKKSPMNPVGLVFDGFAAFYIGVSKFSLEEKIPLFDRAVISLRKAELLNEKPFAGGIKYILGKTYYHKGKYYMDLAIQYLEKALDTGYAAKDLYEYLGLAYSQLENYKISADYFIKAVEKNPSDLLFLTIAQTYYKLGNIQAAEEYLIRTINKTLDKSLEEKSRFLLGKIYIDKNDMIKAENQFEKILEKNNQSADAHFHLGEIYEKLNDTVKARAEWRKALKIDPDHYGARLHLYR
ncbi:MAG: tetratricopeptide repeat protein [Spirochaetota bacterium]